MDSAGRFLFSVKATGDNETGGASYYILIGEAYIHGIMDGDVVRSAEELDVEEVILL